MTQQEIDSYCESVPYIVGAFCGKRKLKYGVGINDLPHITQFMGNDGKVVKHCGYSQWGSVLTRCYCEKYKLRQPTYVGVTVCDEWLYASNFVAWQKTQYREEGWVLDKDLLVVGNKTYSPETCIYMPQRLNTFTVDCGSARGQFLIGVSWHNARQKYVAQCKNPTSRKLEYLGLFTSELEAHVAWRKRKLEIALELKPKMDGIDLRVYPNIVSIISNA